MGELYKISSIDWRPSPVTALATSVDGLRVAAARQDGSLELWLVSPGSIGWHCQLVMSLLTLPPPHYYYYYKVLIYLIFFVFLMQTIHGDPSKRVSSLVWCPGGSNGLPCGRLFSSNIDGSVSKWDLFHLKQTVLYFTFFYFLPPFL